MATTQGFYSSPAAHKARLQRWSRAYFAEKLRQAGFISYNNEDLSWYKLVNGEVLLTFYLYTNRSSMFAFAGAGYGIHPLFINAPIPQKRVIIGWTDDEIMTQLRFYPPFSSTPAEPGILAPATKLCGAETLDKFVLPLFAQIKSLEDAYLWCKNRYLATDAAKRSSATSEFIDIAIYLDDTEIYPICICALENQNCESNTDRQAKKDAQLAAMCDGQRDAYIKLLEARKKRFINRLEKRLGIVVP